MLDRKYYDRLVAAANEKTKEREYWQKKLSGEIVKSNFPCDYGKKSSHSYTMQEFKFSFTGQCYGKLMKLSNNSHQALFLILTADLIILLDKYNAANAKKIILGTPILKQRIKRELINKVLVLSNHIWEDMSFKELLLQVKETFIETMENRNYPMEILAEQLDLSNSEEEFPLFDIAILLENIHDQEDLHHIKTVMTFSFLESGEVVEGRLLYDSSRYRAGSIEQIAAHFQAVLERILDNPDTKIADMDILTQEEKKRLVVEFNDTGTNYPVEKTIAQLFAEQVEKTPDRLAVIYEDRKMTYGELNNRADRLAAVLKSKGVGPDSIVGLMVPRSMEMIIGIMGILKGGAAYLPIEPEIPRDRCIAMLEDCRASILLSHTAAAGKYSFTTLQNLSAERVIPHLTPVRPQIKDLDSLPVPDRSLVDHEKYNKYIGLAAVKDSVCLQGTRGCPFKCAYCHKIWPKTHIVRSAEHIFEEVRTLYDIGIRRFSFIDDIFNLDEKNSRIFLGLVIKNNLKIQLFFPNGLRGELLKKDYIDLLVEAGTVNISLSLETASPRIQKLIRKNLNIEKLRENMAYLCEKHPRVILDVQTMHGFPTETKEEAMMTLDFIKSMKWLHFPYVHVVKIYPNTDMEKLALEHGISKEAIARAEDQAYHELAETLPFDRNFSLRYQAEFLNDYFLSKERLLHVLPLQMTILTEDEIIQKYNAYLAADINSFNDLLEVTGIKGEELGDVEFLPDDYMFVPGLNEKLKKLSSPAVSPAADALKLLILDLTTFFSEKVDVFYDMIEPPLGPLYLLTYLNRKLGSGINGKIAKSRLDFDNYTELKTLLDEFKPDVIGIRSLTFYKNFFHKTISIIRQWGIDVPIIAGGPYPTSDYMRILQDKNIDLVVLGEGEITFSEVIDKIIANSKKLPAEEVLKEIPGIAFVSGRKDSSIEFTREILIMDELTEVLLKEPCGNPEEVNQSSDLAYVIYTSGSTGKPKGTLTANYNVIRVIRDTNYIDLSKSDRLLQLSNYAFDGSVFDIFGALLNGSTLVMLNEQDLFQLSELGDLIRREGITVFFVTTALFNTLVDLNVEALGNVRAILFGGERVSVEHCKKALNALGKNRIVHMYGPTETTVYASYYYVNEIDERLAAVPIGKALANTTIYILDEHLKPIPFGVSGEIFVGGDGVAMGYLNNQELTKQKYLPDPFDRGRQIYRSGDMGRWLPGGNIEFLGRKDHQVKIRGFRIELGEIEKRLLEYPEIKEALVVTREKENKDRYLCAYIIRENELEESELRRYLSRELPDYMIPSYFVRLEKMPLTPQGKVDIKSLPLPGVRDTGEVSAAPTTKVEKKLVEVWAEVLGIEKGNISIKDDFFYLGGHSLTATVLISKMHKELNVKVPLRELFRLPSIEELGRYIEEMEKDRFASIDAVERKEYYLLSSTQKRLYVLQHMQPDSTGYNLPMGHILEGNTDRKKLEETFRQLIQRHESLRTSFHMLKDHLVQVVHDRVEFEIEYYNLATEGTGITEKGVEIENSKFIIQNSFIRPFDLSRAPLLRVGLIKLSQEGTTSLTAGGAAARHILVVDMHHIITDGTSLDLLVKEFMAVYAGKELSLLRLQYKDYSEWQNSEPQREKIKNQEEYWLKMFEGEVPVLDLPADYPRPNIQSFEGRLLEFGLPVEHSMALNDLALKTKSTLYIVLLAVYNVFLSKLSGQEDIVVGTPIAARRHVDLERIIGMFVNTLAVRNYPGGGKTFKDFLKDVRERTLEAFENQEYLFEDLVERVAVNRDLSRNPLFDVLLALPNIEAQTGDIPVVEISGLKISPHESENLTAKFDLNLTCNEINRELFFAFEYSTKLFKPATAARFAAYFKNIVSVIAENVEKKISGIEIISEEEKSQILFDFNNTTAEYPTDKTIHQLFEEQAERTPNRIAVIFEGKQLSYRELNDRANQWAGFLRAKGVKAEIIVGILLMRSIEMIVAIMAVLKAGGAYLPMNPQYPGKRIKYILEDSGAKLILIQENELAENKEAIQNFPLENIINVEDETFYSCETSSSNPEHVNRPQNLAYIIYTSGTTGKPKGVLIEHRNVVRLMFNDKFLFEFDSNDVWTMFHSVAFDFSVWEMYGSLLYGGRLVVIAEMAARDSGGFLEILKKENVTVLNQTPSAFYTLSGEELKHNEKKLNLKYIIFGGEALKPVQLKAWKERYPETKLINMYGITETTVHVTFKEITDNEIRLNISNIGKPLPTLCTYVLDKNLCLLPIGVPGELCVGGEGVGRGYLNRQELISEKFIENPYRPGERLYRSGDLAKLSENGEMEYSGRIDQQVKIRGFRIELGEIASHLLNHTEIKEAVVLEGSAETGDKYLCAYIVGDREFAIPELREYLSKYLPDYMIPSYFVFLEKIPLTFGGKIDSRALPAAEIKTGEYTAPRDEVEGMLARIWAEILGIEEEKIGIDANFFDLGGHSLKSTSMVSEIHKAFNVKLSLAEVFKKPKIRLLAELIKIMEKDEYRSIEPVEKKEYYALSSAQSRLYVLQQMDIESTAYNIPLFIELGEEPDKEILKSTIDKLIKRHETLRTSFAIIGGKPLQVINDAAEFAVEYYETGGEKAEDIMRRFVRPFDPGKAPLMRVGIAIAGNNKYALMIDMHHIISDELSHIILENEYTALYNGEELPPLRLQYKDYSEWQDNLQQRKTLEKQEEYWLSQFKDGIPILNLPGDYQRPDELSFKGDSLVFEINGELTAQIKKLIWGKGVTLNIFLLAAYNVLLARYTVQDDILVGTVVSGRRHADLQNIIGFFVNMLPLRNRPSGDKTFAEFLKEVKENAAAGFENQDYPFEKLVSKLEIQRVSGRHPLIDTVFVFQKVERKTAETPVPRQERLKQNPYKISHFDLMVHATEMSDSIEITIEYSSALFKRPTIEALSKCYIDVLEQVVENEESKLREIGWSHDFVTVESDILNQENIDFEF